MFSNKLLTNLCQNYKVGRISTRFFSPEAKQETDKSATPKSHEKTINHVVLLGRVGNEPLKRGSLEHPAITFSVATHSTYRYENGEYSEKTEWHRIVVFKPTLQEHIFTYLRKGMRVHITGKLSYGTVSDGQTNKAVTSIIADDVIFLHHDGNN